MFKLFCQTTIEQNYNLSKHLWPNLSIKRNISLVSFWLALTLILLSNDVSPNPGPTHGASKFLTMAHWNLNSIKAHAFSRVRLIEAYMSINNCDIFSITETALTRADPDENIEIPGYNLIRKDLPDNDTHGGVLIYYKETLALKHCPNLETQPNVLVTEISFGRKKVYLSTVYRKPSQTPDQFETFSKRFSDLCREINSKNPYLSIFVGDFNAHSSSWWSGDKSDPHGNKLNQIFNDEGLSQLVSQPTHLYSNGASCIDLVITNQPNLFLDCDIHPSLHSTCHHQINFSKVNIENPLPKPYKRRLWHYNRANKEAIQKCLEDFDWENSLNACAHDVNLQVKLYTETVLHVFENYVPFDDSIVNPKEPPWMSKNIKQYYNKYRKAYKNFTSKGRPPDMLSNINEMKEHYTKLIHDANNNYFHKLGSRLKKPNIGPKAYHSALKRLLGESKSIIIPPILSANTFTTDSNEKASLFNSYFAQQCTTIQTDSTLPGDREESSPHKIESINFTETDILDLIRGLNTNKSHGCDSISIRMLKICDKSLVKPLFKIYKNCCEKGAFPLEWKKANVIPIHKKDKKYIVTNYRPISLLSISGKIFEKLIFNDLYAHFFDNNIISDKQSGFRKRDSTIKQLLSICHEISTGFDSSPPLEIRGVFLDISKAFDKVWHKGIIFKLKYHGVQGNLLNIINDFLSNRLQRVCLEGVESTWEKIAAGVPQGSILGPLLFLVYINDLLEGIQSNARVFADDTSLFHTSHDPTTSTNILNQDLATITSWANQWKMVFNPDITKQAVEIVFTTRSNPTTYSDLSFNGIPVKKVNETKHLGVILDSKLSFKSHLEAKMKKATKGVGMIKIIFPYVSRKTLEDIYKMYIRPHLDYADVLYHIPIDTLLFLSPNEIDELNPQMKQIESIQYNAALAASGAWRGTSRIKLYEDLGWEPLYLRRELRRLLLFREIAIEKKSIPL